MVKLLQIISIFLTTLLVCSTTFAKSINLYDAPQKDAKVVGALDSEAGIIAIFTPKNSDWIKVADPRNGNVGWIKSTDMGNTNMTFKVMSGGDGKQSYQIIQYGNTKPYTEEQLKQIRAREEALQQDMQKMVQQMFQNTQHPWAGFPMILPVVILPEKVVTPPTSPNATPTKK